MPITCGMPSRATCVQSFLEIGQHHGGELLGAVAADGDGRDVVDLLRIGDRQQPTVARLHPDRLVVHAPVERVAVAGSGQQLRGRAALGDPGGEPAARRRGPRAARSPRCSRRSAPAPRPRAGCSGVRNWCGRGRRSRRRAPGAPRQAAARGRTSRCSAARWRAARAGPAARSAASRRCGCRSRARHSSSRRAAARRGQARRRGPRRRRNAPGSAPR